MYRGRLAVTLVYPSILITSPSLTSISSGMYGVTVTDDFGCEVDTTVSVYDIGAGTLSFINITDVKCYGESTGSAIVIINGGTPEYNVIFNNVFVVKGKTPKYNSSQISENNFEEISLSRHIKSGTNTLIISTSTENSEFMEFWKAEIQ